MPAVTPGFAFSGEQPVIVWKPYKGGAHDAAVKRFAEHDKVVLAKLYGLRKAEPDSHIQLSNELKEQFARTLREDEDAAATAAKAADKPA